MTHRGRARLVTVAPCEGVTNAGKRCTRRGVLSPDGHYYCQNHHPVVMDRRAHAKARLAEWRPRRARWCLMIDRLRWQWRATSYAGEDVTPVEARIDRALAKLNRADGYFRAWGGKPGPGWRTPYA